jgi:hypothetical protein
MLQRSGLAPGDAAQVSGLIARALPQTNSRPARASR